MNASVFAAHLLGMLKVEWQQDITLSPGRGKNHIAPAPLRCLCFNVFTVCYYHSFTLKFREEVTAVCMIAMLNYNDEEDKSSFVCHNF